eukprot:TRINITY_DN59804_c0_g1_i1.p1 TRINITY_DN59804_c0_g1~~TRINITY_DN59804_c0_g1_i1.p1  ORF type:complete len:348 (+),score=63.53 TRINITY_DN59804_c0_g1_i1:105-1046(+)
MGSAMARRLREKGHSISAWNRSLPKAEALAAETGFAAPCLAAPTAVQALERCAEGAIALMVFTDTKAVCSVLQNPGVGEALRGKTLVNLTSGNPDEGREIAQAVAEASSGQALFLDGAYCGPPTKAREGTGQLFLSEAPVSGAASDDERHPGLARAKPVLAELGQVSFAGNIGASRALDYAVVDLFFANVLSFMSSAAALEKEGVDIKQVVQEAQKRLATVPGAMELYSKKMESREDDAYRTNTTVTLDTARSYWASRLPYNRAHGIPSHFTDLYLSLLDEAAGGPPGAPERQHGSADLSRLQEVVRYGGDRE